MTAYLAKVVIKFGMKATEETYKGFLISCDKNREREALKDAYNFLE